MTIDSTGRVGIGTSAPNEKLTVEGDIEILNSTGGGTANLRIRGTGSNTTSAAIAEIKAVPESTGAATSMTLHTRGSSGAINKHLTINSSGNVGIGTESPSEKLHVNGSARLGDWISKKSFFHDNDAQEDNYIILIKYDTNSFASGKVEGFRNGDTKSRREIIFDFSCSSTAYPEEPVDTEGAIFVRMGALLSGTDLGGFYSLQYQGKKYLSIKVPQSYSYHSLSWDFQGRHSGTDDNFFTLVGYSDLSEPEQDSITLVEDYIQLDKYLYRKGENFGIGTNAPGAKLDISATSSPGGVLRLSNTSHGILPLDTAGRIEFYNSDLTNNAGVHSKIESVAVNYGADYRMDFYTGNVENLKQALTLGYTGNVGIGTNNPVANLEVNDPNSLGVTLDDYRRIARFEGQRHKLDLKTVRTRTIASEDWNDTTYKCNMKNLVLFQITSKFFERRATAYKNKSVLV